MDSNYYYSRAMSILPNDIPYTKILGYETEYFRSKDSCYTISIGNVYILIHLWNLDIQENEKAYDHDLLPFKINRFKEYLNVIGHHYNGIYDMDYPEYPKIFREAAALDHIVEMYYKMQTS